MADRGDTHYFGPTLHKWFFFSSGLLLLSVVWMVIDDWNAPWKNFQREFRDIDAQLARRQLEEASMQQASDMERALQTRLEAAEEALEGSAEEIAAAEAVVDEKREARRVADELAKTVKQGYNWDKYLFEEHRMHGEQGLEDDEIALYQLEGEMHTTARAFEVATVEFEAAQAAVAALQSSVGDLETEISDVTKDLALVRTRLAGLDPETAPEQLANIVRDFPGIDFVDPNMRVQKVLPPGLTVELNFSLGTRIDMCATCHMGIERTGLEDQAQPFTTHPRLDLYMTAKSPHPYNEVGCSICHRGAGQALSFQHADHRPSIEERVWVKDGELVDAGTDGAEEMGETEWWQQSRHWHKQHHWDYPMLSSEYIESSCTQCHQTSMELIADDAPQVTQGYRNFERYGCYACHKVDWFPTTRKPGPSLQSLAQKLTPEFAASWIARPRDFRPSTWMPQVFHLENFAADQAVVQRSNWGAEGPILGQAWNDTAVAAITAYLYDQNVDQPVAPMPADLVGDPEEGRDLFRLSGCLACHNVAEFGAPDVDELYADSDEWEVVADPEGDYAAHRDVDPAELSRGSNEHGPNLRGVSTKVGADWLYRWIKDPASYWAETRMPNLRLSDQEAADIVAYMLADPDGYFMDTPDGWAATAAPVDRAALEEQARWFFMRDGRDTVEDRFGSGGVWGNDQALLVAVGEKFVMNQGCYSCHAINGHETDMPIGAELTNWGTKTVDKLDFGFIANHMQHDQGWSFDEREEFKAYREGWIEQKLREPRSFDREKIKNPSERLRMPWFDFDEETLRSIAVFVVGLVEDEVSLASMQPTPAQLSRDIGLRAMRQKNCAACHVIEPGQLTFLDEDGVERRVAGHFGVLDEEFTPVPADARWDDYLAAYGDILRYYGEDEETAANFDVYFDVWRPEPDLGVDSGGSVDFTYGNLVDYQEPWGGDFVSTVTDYYQAYYNRGSVQEGVLEANGVRRDASQDDYYDVRWPFAPPVLHREGTKLQPEWFYDFLLNPQEIRPQMRVRMPSFSYAEGEAEAIVDYFAQQGVVDYPAWYARKMRLDAEMSAEEVADDMRENHALAVPAAAIEAIEAGSAPDTLANFSKLADYYQNGLEVELWPDVHYWPSVDPGYEVLEHRSRTRREALQAMDPTYFARAHALIEEPPGADPTDVRGVNCAQCHWISGAPPTLNRDSPLAWAPDLAYVRERLREDWVQEWLINPAQVYPNTKMPANFISDDAYQRAFEGTASEQIIAVLDWLYNMDRVELAPAQQ
ncbi:MAG: cytochrome c [Planctomycetota bacterium]|nr:cytochrome c [Planctomycetota bacterium]